MFRSRARRVWGHAAIFTLSDLSWTGVSSSFACSRMPPAPYAQAATPILTSKTTASFTPSPQTPDAVFTPVRGGQTGTLTSGVSSLIEV